MKSRWLLRIHMNFSSTFGSRVHKPCHLAGTFITTTTWNCEDYPKTKNMEDYPLSAVHVEAFLKMPASLEGHERTSINLSFPVTKHLRICVGCCVYGDEISAPLMVRIYLAADRTAACKNVLSYIGWSGRGQLKCGGTRAGNPDFVFRRNGRPESNQAVTRL